LNPVFCFSLDVELGVGVENSKSTRIFNEENERIALKNFFDLAQKYEIPTTIAFCGHLFLNECTCHENTKSVFAPELIEQALKEEHEVACHSFSHSSFQTISAAKAEQELEKSVNAAKNFNLKLDTFIFPRNEVSHLNLLPKYGFKYFTSKIEKQSFFKPVFLTPKLNSSLIDVPRTIYLSRTGLKQNLKLLYFLLNSKFSQKYFHLWCHPFNLLSAKQQQTLEKTFKFVKENNFEVKKINELKPSKED